MSDDIELQKNAILERCAVRIREEYNHDPIGLATNHTRYDALMLNVQRACDASIDLAMHRVRALKLGPPASAREAFTLLEKAGYIAPELAERMRRMVGFANIAVHDYQGIMMDVVVAVVEVHVDDLLTFGRLGLGGAC